MHVKHSTQLLLLHSSCISFWPIQQCRFEDVQLHLQGILDPEDSRPVVELAAGLHWFLPHSADSHAGHC